MIDKKVSPFYVVMGVVVAWYCSHAFGIKPLAQNYHAIKPELAAWHTQTSASQWYGHSIEVDQAGINIARVPVSWDLFIELVILISGALTYFQIEINNPKSRNIVLIVKTIAVSMCLIATGIVVESLDSNSTIIPGNTLLVWLGILLLFGRIILFLPVGKVRYLLPLAFLLLLLHWTSLEYGFGNSETKSASADHVAEQNSTEILEPVSVWEYDSGVVDRLKEAITRVLPMSVRNSGLGGEFANYSAFNLLSYAGIYLIGMAAASLSLTEQHHWRLIGKLLGLAVFCLLACVFVEWLGLPAVPQVASATHVLFVCSLGYGLLVVSQLLTAIKHSDKLLMPVIALGAASALMYVLEHTLGVAFRTEVDKHLEPILEPLFGDAWLKWEPIVFYNLVFLIFLVACSYCYRKRIFFRL